MCSYREGRREICGPFLTDESPHMIANSDGSIFGIMFEGQGREMCLRDTCLEIGGEIV